MFITIKTKNLQNQYALYNLSAADGKLIHVGILPLSELMNMGDFKDVSDYPEVFLSIVKTDVDRLKLVNHGVNYCTRRERTDLRERLLVFAQTWDNAQSNNVRCVDTGEEFASAAEAAREHDLTYTQLIRHLNGVKGYRTVKGRVYEKAGA